MPVRPAAALLTVGSLGSSLAVWVTSGRGLSRPAATAAAVAGRLLLDLAVWAVAAALLGLAASRLAAPDRAEAGSRRPGTDFLAVTACAAAPRVYLLPAAALARLAGAAWLWRYARLAVWAVVLTGLHAAAREAGGLSGRRAALAVALGLALPLALAAAGLALGGLGWLLAPLFPDGFSPFVPL